MSVVESGETHRTVCTVRVTFPDTLRVMPDTLREIARGSSGKSRVMVHGSSGNRRVITGSFADWE